MIPTIKIKSTHPESQGDFVEINESDFDESVHERYIAPPPAPPVAAVPPPPPGAPDPLADLPADWKDKNAGDLKALAAAVSGGRSVDNKAQAVEVIEAALKARAGQ